MIKLQKNPVSTRGVAWEVDEAGFRIKRVQQL